MEREANGSNISRELIDFYTWLYRTDKSDSPDESVHSLIRRARGTIPTLGVDDWAIDLRWTANF